MTPRVDSHQHFWQLARGDYAWLQSDDAALAPLRRDFAPPDLAEVLLAHGVSQTLLVQATDTLTETEFLLALAEQHDFIGGVVGWVDLSRADSVATLQRLSQHPKFKGVRPMLQDLPQIDWIASSVLPAAMEALVGLGLRLDALVKPEHLAALLTALKRWPALPVVIDHAAKPTLQPDWPGTAQWQEQIRALASLPNVCCKFSGLMTQGPAVDAVQLDAIWQTLLHCFGPERLMWGSDWPVLNLASDYADWTERSAALIDALPAAQAAMVWHGTAERFYGLARH